MKMDLLPEICAVISKHLGLSQIASANSVFRVEATLSLFRRSVGLHATRPEVIGIIC